MEKIFNLRTKVDRIVSERSFLNRREESEQLAFEAAKGVYHEQLERNRIVLKRESAERAKVQIRLKQLQAVLAEQREKVASLQDYRDQAKHYTAEIHRLEICADKPRSNIAKLQDELDDRKFELESKRRNSTIQEQDLGVRVTRTVQIQKSNKITFKRLSTTLEAKRPTYSDVKVEATKHDTLYNKLKTTFAAKSRRASKLRNDIKTLETKCEQIKEESKMKQDERRKIMSDTKMLLITKGKYSQI